LLEKPINRILHVEINYNSFNEDYQKKFLDLINLQKIRVDLGIPDSDRLIFNGGWYRNFFYLIEGNVLCHSMIYIRQLNWITENESHYISVWPDFVIKYNPLSVELIEYICQKVRKGEDLFLENHIQDPELLLECEDLISNYCQLVELACRDKGFSPALSANYTLTHNSVLDVNYDKEFYVKARYPEIYLLVKTGQAYKGNTARVLSAVNMRLKFLR
jgi:hypothetical protein